MPKDPHARLTPDQFYWGLLDTSILGGGSTVLSRGTTSTHLDHLFDGLLPIAVEELQTTYLKIATNRYLACGMDRESLDNFIINHHPNTNTITLAPIALPSSITTILPNDLISPIQPALLNLLIGHYESKSVRTKRQHTVLHIAAAILLCGMLIVVGFEGRRGRSDSARTAFMGSQEVVYTHILGPNATSTNAQPLAARFVGELRKLRQTRTPPILSQTNTKSETMGGANVADQTLSRLFAHWQVSTKTLHLQTETISITENSLTIVGVLPTPVEAQLFTSQIQNFDTTNWRARQPAIIANPRNKSVRLTLHFDRMKNVPSTASVTTPVGDSTP